MSEQASLPTTDAYPVRNRSPRLGARASTVLPVPALTYPYSTDPSTAAPVPIARRIPGHRYDTSSQAQPTQFEDDSMGGVEFEHPAERVQREAILRTLMRAGEAQGGRASGASDSSVVILSARQGKARGRAREEDTQGEQEDESLDSFVRRSARKKR